MKVYSATQCDHFVTFEQINVTNGITLSLIDVDSDKVYVNGISVNNFAPITDNTYTLETSILYNVDDTHIAYIHFNQKNESHITLQSSDETLTITHNVGDDITSSNVIPCTKMIDHNTSFQLLRVNPKLTGNIKVVVDSDNNLYIDTFKVSKGLSQRKYRKIKINPDEYYGTSIMSQMKGLSSNDIYKIEDSCYALFSSVNNVGDSYYDTYNSGVRTNTDKLYKENYSLLAPLCIRKNVPDFFLIFKCKDIPEFVSDKDRLDYMIKNGELIKSYDTRENSDLGKYIRTVYKKSKDYPGYIYLSHDYNEYNIYNGISIDRGVVASHYESASLERNIKNQVAMNDWYTLGFERNRIVAKDIINFDFMFDDPSEEVFSLANYFGFYVKLNGEPQEFSCIGSTISYSNEKYVFDADLHGSNFNPADYKNVIYGFSEPNGFHRLLSNISVNNKNGTNELSAYAKKPYKCILSSDVIPHDNSTSYVRFKMTDVFEAGEHYRVIDTMNRIIYDVIISNYESSYDCSEVSFDYVNDFEIRKVSVYNFSHRDDNNKSLSMQLPIISNAFNKMNPGIISAKTNNTDSIVITYNRTFNYNEPDLIFERVLSNCGCIDDLDINTKEYDKSCKVFDLDPTLFRVYTDNFDYFFPCGFESLGDRLVHATSFIPTQYDDFEICVFSDNIDDAISNHYGVIYKLLNRPDYNYTTVNENSNVIKSYGLAKDDDGNDIRTWINTNVISFVGNTTTPSYARFFNKGEYYPDTTDGVLRLYQNYPLNAGICSIFPVKDFETNVYDTNSQISFNEIDGNVSMDGGRYTSTDNIFSSSLLDGEEEYLCDYIDKNENLKSVDATYLDRSNDTLKDYINNLLINNIKKSDISLIVPYCCKWESTGTDLTGNRIRIMYPTQKSNYTSLSETNNSYFIADDNSYGIGYVSVSQNTVDGENDFSEKYVNDNYSTKEHHNYREYITHGIGSLDDILYLDASISKDTHSKWSRVYKHGNNTIEFISGGVKIRLASSNETIVNLSKYNGYSGILICMDGNNPLRENNIELFVDETKEQLAVFYYNGTQSRITNFDSSLHISDDWSVNRIQLNKPLTSLMVEKYVQFDDNEQSYSATQIAIPDDAGFYNNNDISTTKGILIATSPVLNYDAYTREVFNLVKSDVDDIITNNTIPNHILGDNPIIKSGSQNVNATNGNILNNLDKISHTSDMFMFTKNSCIPKFQSVANIKTKSSDVAVYIKTSNTTRDYSGKNSIITMDIVDTISFTREQSDFTYTDGDIVNTHSTYCMPLVKDVFDFSYNDTTIRHLSNTFEMDFRGCNTVISSENTSVNTINQMWIQKYIFSKKDNSSNTTLTLAELKDFSVLQSCFENKMFRTYTSGDTYTVNNGVDSGYEKNTFFGSRGLQLKTGNEDNTITLTNWIDTVVDENNRTIRLNITETLINYITFSDGFKSNWTRFISTDTINKTKYIKNSILNHINITSNGTFNLYVVEGSTIFKFFDYSDIYNYNKINNMSNRIVCENDIYYIELNNLDAHVYSATFTIKL